MRTRRDEPGPGHPQCRSSQGQRNSGVELALGQGGEVELELAAGQGTELEIDPVPRACQYELCDRFIFRPVEICRIRSGRNHKRFVVIAAALLLVSVV